MEPLLIAELEQCFGYPGEKVDYLCNIGKRHAFLYVETPKVACSSIKRTLQVLELGGRSPPPDDVHDKSVSPLHGALSSGWSFERLFLSPELFRFTFVRNPYERILSCYLEKILQDESERKQHHLWLGFQQIEPVSFLEFLRAIDAIAEHDRDIHWKSQAATINDGFIQYNLIGRFEHLDRDFLGALTEMGIRGQLPSLQDISHHKTGARSKLRQFYGSAELAAARKLYNQDFIRYGYSYELPE